MATGTGNLPASNDSTSPFQILTSEHMNNIKANIDALADGSGLGDGSVGPAKRSGGFMVMSHTFSAGTGNKSITGFGFKPKLVTFTLSPSPSNTVAFVGSGVAYDTGSTPNGYGHAVAADGSTGRSSRGSHFIAANTSSTTYQGEVTSFDADGITVNISVDASSAYRTWIITAWG